MQFYDFKTKLKPKSKFKLNLNLNLKLNFNLIKIILYDIVNEMYFTQILKWLNLYTYMLNFKIIDKNISPNDKA